MNTPSLNLPVINGHKVIGVIATSYRRDGAQAFAIIVDRGDEYYSPYAVAEWYEGESQWNQGEYDISTYGAAFQSALDRATRLNGLVPVEVW